jgi:hypothetical protein
MTVVNLVVRIVTDFVSFPLTYALQLIGTILLSRHALDSSVDMINKNVQEGKSMTEGMYSGDRLSDVSDSTIEDFENSKVVLFLIKTKYLGGLLIWSMLDKFIFHIILK